MTQLGAIAASKGMFVPAGKSVIAAQGQSTTGSYGALDNGPDQVSGVVLPTDGLLWVMFDALYRIRNSSGLSLTGATMTSDARAALFLHNGTTDNQLEYMQASSSGAGPQSVSLDSIGSGTVTNGSATNWGRVVAATTPSFQGLHVIGSASSNGIGEEDTTAQANGLLMHAPIIVRAAAGTYTVAVKFWNGGGATLPLEVKERRLWVATAEF